jgi:predicted HicB family RNase H-like nuclease
VSLYLSEETMPGATANTTTLEDQQPAPDPVSGDRRSIGRRRLTIEVSPELHRRILAICTTRGVPVNQAVRELLEKSFPE